MLKLIVKLKVIVLLCSTHKTVTFSMMGRIRIRDGLHAARGSPIENRWLRESKLAGLVRLIWFNGDSKIRIGWSFVIVGCVRQV